MERRDPPPTEEGWFALHDFRTVDWATWRDATGREREAAIEEGRAFLESAEGTDEGASITYAIAGQKADLLVVHLRPTMADVETLERRFEGTALADVTERAHSYVSVTEVSGYTTDAFVDGSIEDVEDAGLRNYLQSRLYPTIPDADHVCFYPMSKRRDPEHNWYDLSFEERAEHMRRHGEIGREYAGEVSQVITGSIGFDDWEWGVTLFANDPTAFKRLLYEMRFDPSTSYYAEFGPFFTGRRLEPSALAGYLDGAALGEGEDGEGSETTTAGGEDAGHPHGDDAAGSGDIRETLADLGVYAGQPHGEDVYALVLYSEADPDELSEAVDGLRSNFEHYDTHVKTAVYEPRGGGDPAVASIWETERAAETAAGFLADLPGVTRRVAEGDGDDGFDTLGMFYTVKPEHRESFVATFDEVGTTLAEMDGHRETVLYVNREDENDAFIDSRWESKDDALAFFRSDAFAQTVDWGRDVLADRPRHVFFA